MEIYARFLIYTHGKTLASPRFHELGRVARGASVNKNTSTRRLARASQVPCTKNAPPPHTLRALRAPDRLGRYPELVLSPDEFDLANDTGIQLHSAPAFHYARSGKQITCCSPPRLGPLSLSP